MTGNIEFNDATNSGGDTDDEPVALEGDVLVLIFMIFLIAYFHNGYPSVLYWPMSSFYFDGSPGTAGGVWAVSYSFLILIVYAANSLGSNSKPCRRCLDHLVKSDSVENCLQTASTYRVPCEFESN